MSKGFDADACASKGHADAASKHTAKSTALTRSVKGVSQDSAWIKGAWAHAYTRAIRTTRTAKVVTASTHQASAPRCSTPRVRW
jgi:hypothetical protein